MNISLRRWKGSMTMASFMFSSRIRSNSRHYSLEVWEIVIPKIWTNPWGVIACKEHHNGRRMSKCCHELRAPD
jgi:hypothetical protein